MLSRAGMRTGVSTRTCQPVGRARSIARRHFTEPVECFRPFVSFFAIYASRPGSIHAHALVPRDAGTTRLGCRNLILGKSETAGPFPDSCLHAIKQY